MELTQLRNWVKSKTGRKIYVSSDDFNASDSLNRRGNSILQPFKTLQRALLEVARYSYEPGFNNDRFSEFTIQLDPGNYYIDNRPSDSNNLVTALPYDVNTKQFDDSKISTDISDENNIYRQFNSTEGGCIIPRGCGIVNLDLRHCQIRPLYVPDPLDVELGRTGLFNVTGESYFFGFTILDGDFSDNSPLWNKQNQIGEVYSDKSNTKASPLYSHHKIVGFAFTPKSELDLYYKKIASAFVEYQPNIDEEGEFSDRIEETRIVGPLSDRRSIQKIELIPSRESSSSTDVVVELKSNHPYFKGQFVSISDTGIDDVLEGVFPVSSISGSNQKQFTYKVPISPAGIGRGYIVNPIVPNIINDTSLPPLGTNASSSAEIDTTESASPYVLNVTLRSDWGMCGMWADGLKSTGFRSMVVAQYTGISLQKDDRAFVRYDDLTNTWDQAPLDSAFSPKVEHTKGDSYWKTDWRTFHIRASNSAFIQCVSVFAIGQGSHFLMESGGDMSITNSNSNFGDTSLHAKGFNRFAYAKDKNGYISDIIPPKIVNEDSSNEIKVPYYVIDIPNTISGDEFNRNKLYLGNDDNNDPYDRPVATIKGQRIGAKSNEKLYVKLDPETVGGEEIFNANVSPSGFKKYITSLSNVSPTEVTSVGVGKAIDAANLIESNKILIQEEAFGYMLYKYPELRASEKLFPNRTDFNTTNERNRLFDAVNLIESNKRYIQDETYKVTASKFGGPDKPHLNNDNVQVRRESKCFRDIGFFIDAIIGDLYRGGNQQIRDFVNFYRDKNTDNIIHVNDELIETLYAFEYAGKLASLAMRNFEFSISEIMVEGDTLIVNDNFGIVVGMVVKTTNGESIGNVSEIVNNDRVRLTNEDGNIISPLIGIPQTLNFVLENSENSDNSIAIIRDDNVTLDNSIFKCINVYERIFRLTQNVISIFNNEDIIFEEPEDQPADSPCYRDIGYFIDAIIGDLKSGGNLRSVKVGRTYVSELGSDPQFIQNELTETIDTYEYASNIAIAAMRNFEFAINGKITEIENSELIQIELDDISGVIIGMKARGENIPQNCYVKAIDSDNNKILIGSDKSLIEYGTGFSDVPSTNSFIPIVFTVDNILQWSNENISVDSSITSEPIQNRCSDIANRIEGMAQVVVDILSNKEIETITPNDLLSRENNQSGRGKLLDAANLIEDNKQLIIEQAIARVTYAYPDFTFPGKSDELCKRDIGLYVDALVADLRLGGNLNTLKVGESYRDRNNELIHIEGEENETKHAFRYATYVSVVVMRNFNDYVINIQPNGTIGNEIIIDGMKFRYDRKDYEVRYSDDFSKIEIYTSNGNFVSEDETSEIISNNNNKLSLSINRNDLRSSSEFFNRNSELMPLEENKCNDIKDRLLELHEDVARRIDGGSPIRIAPDTQLSFGSARATIFNIDISGESSSDAHNLQTGTPVRLVPRPKFNNITCQYEDINSNVVRLPKGFETNKVYYVIAPGRTTSPYNYSSGIDSEFSASNKSKTKLMLASSKEAALAGLYLYSPEGDSVDSNVEIDLYSFITDQSYDLEVFRCIEITGSRIRTSTNHSFDASYDNNSNTFTENLVRVFLRPIPGSTNSSLPKVAVSSRENIVDDEGNIREDIEFYAKFSDNNIFTLHKLDNVQSPIVFEQTDIPFNVLVCNREVPLKYDPVIGKWYLQVESPNSIISRLSDREYSARLRTTESWYTRINDDRSPQDRIYRLRYVIPSYNQNASPPSNGFTIKTRNDDLRRLPSQKIIVKGNPVFRDAFTNDLMITKQQFSDFGLGDSNIYDPYRRSVLGDTRIRIKTESNMVATVQSAKYYNSNNQNYTEIFIFDPEVDSSENVELENTRFTVIQIDKPQNGDGIFTKDEEISWDSGIATVHFYINHKNRHYLILKDVEGTLDNQRNSSIQQGKVTSKIISLPDFGMSADITAKVKYNLENYYFARTDASVYTLVPGDSFQDDSGEKFVIESIDNTEEIENTYYIYSSETIQEHVYNQQDGIYYLSIFKGDISPNLTNAGIGDNFSNFKFSQPIGSLYPIDNKNDPLWYKNAFTSDTERNYVSGLKDPLPTNSAADNFLHGLVTVNDFQRSSSKEAILDLLKNSPFVQNTYVIEAQEGLSASGSEDRLIPIMGDDPFVSRSRYYVELRRYSIARAGNHTFEYLGYGPGNYSTALPIRQQQVKSRLENFYSQSKKEDGGVVFYTGSDSTGGFYIGNRVFDSITNGVTVLESSDIGEIQIENDIINTSLVETFDTPVTFNSNISVIGNDGTSPSIFESPVLFSVQGNDLSQQSYPIVVRSNVLSSDDLFLDRTNFRPFQEGDIVIGKNLVKSASFKLSGRSFGQSYSIKTHVDSDGNASNRNPSSGTSGENKSGDILLKGKNIDNIGSLGWIYTNQQNSPIILQNISSIEFENNRIRINWNGSDSNSTQGVTNISEVIFSGFDSGYEFVNGTWRVDSSTYSRDNQYVHVEGFEVPEDTQTLSALTDRITIVISNPKWKEFLAIGTEAIRLDSDRFGDYKLGINTLSRSNVNPEYNLDVFGNASISGLLGMQDDAFVVGDVSAPTFRVSSLNDQWKIGFNVDNIEDFDDNYLITVNGNIDFKGDFIKLSKTVNIGVDNDPDSIVGNVSLFDKVLTSVDQSPYVGAITIGNDASVINISASEVHNDNIINIGRSKSDNRPEDSSKINLKTSLVDVAGNMILGSSKANDSFIITTEANTVSIFDLTPSSISIGESTPLISIGAFIGQTIINNQLIVGSDFTIEGSITLVGGSDAATFTVVRGALSTEPVSFAEGDASNLNVDVVSVEEEVILTIDTRGGGEWPGPIHVDGVFYSLPVRPPTSEVNIRVGDYLLIQEEEIVKVVKIDNLVDPLNSVHSITVERGIISTAKLSGRNDESTIQKCRFINNSTFLSNSITESSDIVELATVSSGIKSGDYLVLDDQEAVKVQEVTDGIPRVFSVNDGENDIFSVNTSDRILTFDGQQLDIVGDLNVTSNSTITLNSNNLKISSEYVDLKVGSENDRFIDITKQENTNSILLNADTISFKTSADNPDNKIEIESNCFTINRISDSLPILKIDGITTRLSLISDNSTIRLGIDDDIPLLSLSTEDNNITLNPNNITINANEQVFLNKFNASDNTLKVEVGSITSEGQWTHDGDLNVISKINIGGVTSNNDELFRVNANENKNFVVKRDGSIDAFGITNYFTRTGGRKFIGLTNSSPEILPDLNSVYFFDSTGLENSTNGEKIFIMPSNPNNGDFIEFVTIGQLHNKKRIVLRGADEDHIQKDTEGLMLNTPYASNKLWYWNDGWYLGVL